jgi:hypothetical protein
VADRNEGKALGAVLRFTETRDNALRKEMAGRQTTGRRIGCGESTTFALSAKRSMRPTTPVRSSHPCRRDGFSSYLLRQLWPQEVSSARVGTAKRAINAAANKTTLLAPKTAVAPLKS